MIYKLIVISDIHHDIARLQAIMPLINISDYLIFCGDGLDDIMSMQGYIMVPTVCVRGNNDWNTNIAEMGSIVLGNTRALITHGHKQNVRYGVSGLINAARVKGCNLVFYGHTHVFSDRVVDGVHLICPGALRDGSYAAVVGDGITFTCKQEFI